MYNKSDRTFKSIEYAYTDLDRKGESRQSPSGGTVLGAEHKYGFRADDQADTTPINSGNKIIHGDKLEVLKSVHEGRVKSIYIDPPYNTGNEKWTTTTM